jgi:hypothetical protein
LENGCHLGETGGPPVPERSSTITIITRGGNTENVCCRYMLLRVRVEPAEDAAKCDGHFPFKRIATNVRGYIRT